MAQSPSEEELIAGRASDRKKSAINEQMMWTPTNGKTAEKERD